MSLSKEQFDHALSELRDVLRDWDAESSHHPAQGKTFEVWLEAAQKLGADRRDVHSIVWEILNQDPPQFSQDSLNELSEIETALTGYCHPDSIIRFPNEPTDEEELLKYVRGNVWR
jgi:hypothetical protein